MTPAAVLQAADLLEAARREARALSGLPESCRPGGLEEGYRVQAELMRRWGPVAGWKVGAPLPDQQAKLGLDRPLGGAVPAAFVHASPARFELGRFIAPALECEFAFALARDLPPRASPYARAEVEAAVAALHPAIEIADSRLGANPPMPQFAADWVGNGALVYGPAYADWRRLDFARHAMVLMVDAKEAARGTGAALLGDPLAALLALANAQPPGAGGLKAGHIVSTGSCTGMVPVRAPGEAAADFGRLGEVRVSFA
ncbi:MAG: 2-keto-4-pentenoate hydratase [Pseudomonadota bacterium]